MKVKLQKDYKCYYTFVDLEIAKRVISETKEDEYTAKEWAEYAIREALRGTNDYIEEVIRASAETAKNRRANDAYFEGSRDMDVWVEATAKTTWGFIEIGAYLSDIWQTGGTPYKQHMYIQYYKRAEL